MADVNLGERERKREKTLARSRSISSSRSLLSEFKYELYIISFGWNLSIIYSIIFLTSHTKKFVPLFSTLNKTWTRPNHCSKFTICIHWKSGKNVNYKQWRTKQQQQQQRKKFACYVIISEDDFFNDEEKEKKKPPHHQHIDSKCVCISCIFTIKMEHDDRSFEFALKSLFFFACSPIKSDLERKKKSA